MQIGAIIQARTGSSRLPGKVMLKLKDKPVIRHVIERVRQSKRIARVIVATTTLEQDTVIQDELRDAGVDIFRGDELDVLSRYYHAALTYKVEIIVRITADCPLIDPFVIDDVVDKFLLNKKTLDYLSNVGSVPEHRTFPRGLDVEVFTFQALAKAFRDACQPHEREHVTPYIYNRPDLFRIAYTRNPKDYSCYRWTLDAPEDWVLISYVYDKLYQGTHNFYFKEIVDLFEQYPELARINSHLERAMRSSHGKI